MQESLCYTLEWFILNSTILNTRSINEFRILYLMCHGYTVLNIIILTFYVQIKLSSAKT